MRISWKCENPVGRYLTGLEGWWTGDQSVEKWIFYFGVGEDGQVGEFHFGGTAIKKEAFKWFKNKPQN